MKNSIDKANELIDIFKAEIDHNPLLIIDDFTEHIKKDNLFDKHTREGVYNYHIGEYTVKIAVQGDSDGDRTGVINLELLKNGTTVRKEPVGII